MLDEPFNGLDPDGIWMMRAFLRTFADRGGTVFLSSHLLAEVAHTADDAVIITPRPARPRGNRSRPRAARRRLRRHAGRTGPRRGPVRGRRQGGADRAGRAAGPRRGRGDDRGRRRSRGRARDGPPGAVRRPRVRFQELVHAAGTANPAPRRPRRPSSGRPDPPTTRSCPRDHHHAGHALQAETDLAAAVPADLRRVPQADVHAGGLRRIRRHGRARRRRPGHQRPPGGDERAAGPRDHRQREQVALGVGRHGHDDAHPGDPRDGRRVPAPDDPRDLPRRAAQGSRARREARAHGRAGPGRRRRRLRPDPRDRDPALRRQGRAHLPIDIGRYWLGATLATGCYALLGVAVGASSATPSARSSAPWYGCRWWSS